MYDDDTLTGLDHPGRVRAPRPGRSLSSRGAIYHLNARTGSRSKGHSARASAAYIQRTAEYSRDHAAELVYTASGHMPAWAEADPTTYWDAADLYERANGRLFKRVEVALPLALSAAEQRELAVGFAHHLTDGEHLPYTLAIHAGAGTNPHCHLLISERGNDGLERAPEQWFRRYNAAAPERGGARKSEALKPKAWLEEAREAWAAQTNQALARAGREVRIDHRSYVEQGIERLPSLHLGPTVQAMEARGIETERGTEARRRAQVNAELAAAAEAGVQEPSAPALPPSRWEAVKQRVGGWLSRTQAPAPVPDPPPALDAPENTPPRIETVDEAYRRRAEQEHAARKTRARILERPEEVEAAIAQIADPADRAKAERLLETVRREEATRQRARERDDFDRER